MKKIITFFLLIPAIALADETIYTWGYGDIMAHIIRSVKYIFVTNDYVGLFKIFAVIGLVLVLFSYLGKNTDPMALIKYYITSVAMYYLFISPTVFKTNIYIDDLNNNNYDQTITDVPALYAKVLSVFSILEKTTANLFETAFSLPNDLKYSNSGLLSAFGLMSNANSHRIMDTYLYLSINDYINDCVFPDIVDGTKDIYALARSSDLWTDLGGTSAARTTKYYSSSNPDGVIMTCTDAYNNITSTLNNYIINTGLPYLANFVGAYSSAQINNTLGVASQYYLDYAVTGQAYLRQSIAMNMFSEAFQNFAKVNAISGTGLALGAAKVEETARNNMALSGVLGAKYIPVIKGILTALIAAFIPLLILLMVTPMFTRILIGFFTILFWLSLWHLGDVFINAIINVKASGFLQTAAGGEYNLLNKGVIDTSILDYINMVSSFYWAIPTLSFMIASGFSIYAMNSLNQQMAGKVQGSTGGVAGEMATGSIDTSSKLNTGKQWDFSSFESGGVQTSYGMNHSENWGTEKTVNYAESGLLGNQRLGNVQGVGDTSKVADTAVPRIGGVVENSVGEVNGNVMKLTGGYTGDLRVTNSNLSKNKDGTYSGTIEGIASDGSKWTFSLDRNTITEATGSKDGITYHFFKDKGGHDRLDVKLGENMSLSAIKGEDGQWHVQTATGPTDVKFTEEFLRNLNQEEFLLRGLTTKEAITKGFKEGDSHTKQSMLSLNYDYLTRETDKTSDSYKYAYAKTKAIEEDIIRMLGKSAVKDYKHGEKIDRASERKAVIEGGVKLSRGLVSGALQLSLAGKLQQAWAYKDAVYVQTSDGQMYKFEFSSQAREMRADRFAEEHNTDLSKSSAYEELSRAGINNNHAYAHAQESYYQHLVETAISKVANLRSIISYMESNKTGITDNMMRFVIEDYADRHNMSYVEAFRQINQHPDIVYEYFNNPDAMDRLLINYADNMTDVIQKTDEARKTLQQEENVFTQVQTKSPLDNIETVQTREFSKDSAQILAQKNEITPDKADVSFNKQLQQFVNRNMLPPIMSPSYIKKMVKEKGLNEVKVYEELNEFKTRLVDFNKDTGLNYTVSDFRSGKIDDAIAITERTLENWRSNPAFLSSETNRKIYNQLSENLQSLKQLRDEYEKVSMDVTIWQMYTQIEKDKLYSHTMPEVDKGGLLSNPKIEHYEGEYQEKRELKPPYHGPEYKFPR